MFSLKAAVLKWKREELKKWVELLLSVACGQLRDAGINLLPKLVPCESVQI